jgi:WD40 repeat protein
MASQQSPQDAVGSASQPSWIAPVKPVVPDHELFVRIGGGSYGDVWLARSVVGTWRAVKVVFRDRFLDAKPYEREFSGIQKFEPLSRSNEGFIDVLQIGRNDTEGYFYYIMELADDASGAAEIQPETYVPKTLAKALLQRGRLPVSDCLELGITLNLGLTRLHDAGLIHRDIKPSNIIFVGGVPKLADIGLVIEVAEARSYVGTEGFIPPEGPNSPQADLYSLGKVLYEAGMGKDRKDFPEPLTRIGQAPDSAELLEFNAILLKACAANLKDRYQSAGEMNADLALLQSGGSVRRQRTLSRRLRTIQRAGALVTVLALVIGTGWLWQARQTRLVRQLANEKSRLADDKSRLAIERSALAEENRDRVVRLDIANGVRLMDQEDLSGALLWFADALPRVSNRGSEEEIHRIRIQQTLDVMPKLLGVVSEGGSIRTSAFSHNGRFFATGSFALEGARKTGTVTLWDAGSCQKVWGTTHLGKPIRYVRFSQDDRRLLVSSAIVQGKGSEQLPLELQLAEVLNVETGAPAFSPVQTNLEISAFSPGDSLLAVAHTNHVIELLRTQDGVSVARIQGHTNRISMLAFSEDNSLLASASSDGSVWIWRLPSGEPIGKPLVHEQSLCKVAFNRDGRYLATAVFPFRGGNSNQVQVWDVRTGKKIGVPILEAGESRAMFFGHSKQVELFTSGEGIHGGHLGDEEHRVRVWAINPDSGISLARTLIFPEVRCWDFSPDGSKLALGTDHAFVTIWDTQTWEPLFSPIHQQGWLESVSFSADGKRLLTADDNATAELWSINSTPHCAHSSLSASFYDVPASAERPRGQNPGPLAVPLRDKRLHLIDPSSLTEIKALCPLETLEETNASDLMWCAGTTGQHWAVFWQPTSEKGYAKEITLWTARQEVFQSLRLPVSAELVQFNADDSRLATIGFDQVLRLWRTSDGALEHAVPLPEGCLGFDTSVLPEIFDKDLRRLITVIGGDQPAKFFLRTVDSITGQFVGPAIPLSKLGSGRADRMRISPDGDRLATVGNQTGTIIDLRTGEFTTLAFKHAGDPMDVEWSHDGKEVLTSGYASKRWNSMNGEMLGAPMDGIGSAHWSADGRFIATHGYDSKVRVYDATTTEAVTPFFRHRGFVRWVCVTPADRLITASDPNLLRAWDLKPTTLAPNVIADYAKLLSGRRLSAAGVMLPVPASELADLAHALRAKAPQLFE